MAGNSVLRNVLPEIHRLWRLGVDAHTGHVIGKRVAIALQSLADRTRSARYHRLFQVEVCTHTGRRA